VTVCERLLFKTEAGESLHLPQTINLGPVGPVRLRFGFPAQRGVNGAVEGCEASQAAVAEASLNQIPLPPKLPSGRQRQRMRSERTMPETFPVSRRP
jgi:hypothetical protein